MNREASTKNDQLLSSVNRGLNYNTMEQGDPLPRKKPNRKPTSTFLKWLKWILIAVVAVLVLLIVSVYVGIPLGVYFSSTVRRNLLFQGFLTNANGLSDPESFGLECSRNFFVSSGQGVRLGAWYVQSQATPCLADRLWFPGNSTMTVLYLHGITKTRAARNRRQLMEKLTAEVKTHVVAIDYRGFGDSTDETPSLSGVVQDALATYKRLRATLPNENIVIWGHSLGTSVAMYLSSILHEQHDDPAAVVLEAALDSVGNVVRHNRVAKHYRWLPCFHKVFTEPFEEDPATAFNSTLMASRVNPKVPVLMLHAEDDLTVPINHGLSLYRSIAAARRGVSGAGSVTFIPFSASHHFGHSMIAFYEKIAQIVHKFLTSKPEGPAVVEPVI